jgi:hypothetical protein
MPNIQPAVPDERLVVMHSVTTIPATRDVRGEVW